MAKTNPWRWEEYARGTAFRASSHFGLGDGGNLLVARLSEPQIVLGLPDLKDQAGAGNRVMSSGGIFRLDGSPYAHNCLYVENLSKTTESPTIITADAQLEYQVCYEGDCGETTRNAAFFNNGNMVAVYGNSDYFEKVNLEKLRDYSRDARDGTRLVPVFKQVMDEHAKREAEHCPDKLKNYSFGEIRKLLRQLDPEFRTAFNALL